MKPRMPRRTASLNVTLGPVTVARVTPAEAYFGGAEALMPGAELLAAAPSASGVALTLVSAHILECLLKAFLSKQGISVDKLKKKPLGHNLAELWRRCQARGLSLSPTLPPWVDRLSDLHKEPFRLRYPMDSHGLVLPGSHPMSQELRDLFEVVRRAIR